MLKVYDMYQKHGVDDYYKNFSDKDLTFTIEK